MIYLVDKSAWEQLRHSEAARERFAHLAEANEVATCPVIAAELLFSAKNHQQLRAHRAQLERVLWVDTSDDAAHGMLGVQQTLATRGHHRSVGIADLLIASTAEAHWATLLHYDSDFERIAELTGQPHEWIVPRGEGHGSA